MYRGPSPPNARTPTSGVYLTPEAGAQGGGRADKIYAQAELPCLLRRLPLEPNRPFLFNVLAPGTVTATLLQATLQGEERVTVPAGTFVCSRVALRPVAQSSAPPFSTMAVDFPMPSDGETYWIAREGRRPVVKIAFGGLQGELTSLRSGEAQGASTYRDVAVGYSFSVPQGWIAHGRRTMDGNGSSVDLIDPGSQTFVIVSGKSVHINAADIPAALRSRVDNLMQRSSSGPNLARKIAPDDDRGALALGLTGRTIAGHKALTLTAESGPGRIRYTTWVQSESTRVSITFATDRADFPGVRQRLQPILDSFRMP
jgi:hypothetical protein